MNGIGFSAFLQMYGIPTAETSQAWDAQYKSKHDELHEPTSDALVKTRKIGSDDVRYVDHVDVTRTLNRHFAGNWDFLVIDSEFLCWEVDGKDQPNEVRVLGALIVNQGGHRVVKMAFGSSSINYNSKGQPISLGDPHKGACSDCLRKAAALLGVHLDVYQKPGKGKKPAQTQEEQQHDREAKKAKANADADYWKMYTGITEITSQENWRKVASSVRNKCTDIHGVLDVDRVKKAIEIWKAHGTPYYQGETNGETAKQTVNQ